MGYNARKAAQTIAYFAIKNDRKPLDLVKAVKLVYLSDRESIARYGFPIQDEPHVSMPHGPVNSNTYSYIKRNADLVECGWADFIQEEMKFKLSLARDSLNENDLDELSDADIAVLEAIWEKFGQMDQWEIRDWTHNRNNVPEWENPNGSSKPIPLEKLMDCVGVTNSTQQAATVMAFAQIDDIFRSL